MEYKKPVKKALWRVFVDGRYEEVKTLGYVIASGSDLHWIKRSYNIGCSVVREVN